MSENSLVVGEKSQHFAIGPKIEPMNYILHWNFSEHNLSIHNHYGFPELMVKNPPANAGNIRVSGSVPG